jgi:RNA polymerase sigma-70 factor
MPADTPTTPAERGLGLQEFLATHARLIDRLYEKAEAARWNLTAPQFAQALQRSAEHHFCGGFGGVRPKAAELATYLASLHVQDLALACACRDGNEQAWEHFIQKYRQDLYAAARAITGHAGAGAGEARARELADSIYAELYGLERREGHRRSLLDYFHGRSKLSTWLRAVLAQRYVDALRAGRRAESYEEKVEADEAAILRARGSPASPDPDRARYLALLQAALLEALAALSPRDRLRLAYYYVQELTLARIGRILGEHEATTSRSLDRTRQSVRGHVERALRAEKRLSDAQIRLCFAYAMEEWPFDLTRALSPEASGPKLGGE